MREFVGECAQCGKQIFCENGFLNGNIQEDGTLLCLECEEESTE